MALQARRAPLCLRCVPNNTSIATTLLRAASTSTYPHNISTNKPPPYPYGPTLRYRRADSGLYGGSSIQFGNKVSEKNEIKTRRVWRPNIHNKRLWSNYLGKFVQVKVQARVLRTVDKLGGLDEYLVGSDTPARIKELGVAGWGLRWRVMQTRAYKERVLDERRRLGIPERGWEVEEKERKRAERRAAVKVADTYVGALEVERVERRKLEQEQRWSRELAEELEKATGDVVEEIEAKAEAADAVEEIEAKAEAREEETENDIEPEYEVEEDSTEEDRENAQKVDAALEKAALKPTPIQSGVLFAQLTELATAIHSTPHNLIKQARDTRRHRAQQLTAHAEETARLAEEQADLLSEIDAALAAPNPGPILNLYNAQLAIAREEAALAREQAGKKPLSREQVEQHVFGPAFNTPKDKWMEVRAKVKEIKQAQPKRLKLRRERRARNVERRKYWEEHREEYLAEKERKRAEAGVVGRVKEVGYSVQRGPRGWWGGLKGMVGMGGKRKVAQTS